MLQRFVDDFRRFDWGLFLPVLILSLIGLAVIYSITINQPDRSYGTFTRQLIFFGVGLFLMFAASFVDYRALRSYSIILYGIGALALIVVFLFGVTIRGTTGWLPVGFSQAVQPVEFVKLFFIIFIAWYFSNHVSELHRWKPVVITGVAMLFYVGLVMQQPDLGSALVIVGIWLGMLLVLNIRRSVILLILMAFVVVGAIAWTGFLQDYQKDRILTFVDPNRDPLVQGYNIRQSIVAVGSGQLFGRGLGLGPQSQLNFLPEQQTDFIFAVIAEELGFIGALIILLTFGALFYKLITLTRNARDDFSAFLTIGVILLFFIQMFVNIGMNIGVVPIVGIPIPFISAGGSSLIASLIIIGIIESIRIHRPTHRLDRNDGQ